MAATDPAARLIRSGRRLDDDDIRLFQAGRHSRLFEKLGAHLVPTSDNDGQAGATFAVWAPHARSVSVIGDFNQWDVDRHPLRRSECGVWEGFIPGVVHGATYKYHIVSDQSDYCVDKADPFAFAAEPPPQTASVVYRLDYSWNDIEWMRRRKERNALDAPISVYEVHLGSWRRRVGNGGFLTYRDLADPLAEYVRQMGFTHVEFMPVMEHPFYGSWGYQVTGYFAPTRRYGDPTDLMYLIDYLHQRGIGVILDWVPSHFPTDESGLIYFDGTPLYEHADPRRGRHQDWDTAIFDYGRHEVRSFLLSSARFWLEKYHADGLRVDGVASMLYLDYSRKEGEWLPNKYGGRENLDAIDFLRQLNEELYTAFPDIQTIAEESTSWPMVSRPAHLGGLGFGLKWDMGWMNDTLHYFAEEPVYRKYHHNRLTFRMMYAFTENFMLALSHDEVVHEKGSLLAKMPGDAWQKFANLRLLFGYMFALPGKKLLFMGDEFGQWREWNHDRSLDWNLLQYPTHRGIQRWVEDLNRLYTDEPILHQLDTESAGFQWVESNDAEQSVLTFLRRGRSGQDSILVACNFTPVPRYNYRVGVPVGGYWRELLNSDAREYGGSGQGNLGGVEATPIRCHGRPASLNLTMPPLGVIFLKNQPKPTEEPQDTAR